MIQKFLKVHTKTLLKHFLSSLILDNFRVYKCSWILRFFGKSTKIVPREICLISLSSKINLSETLKNNSASLHFKL